MTAATTHRATGTFELNTEQQPPYDEAGGVALARWTITKKFHGDIQGTSVAHLITALTGREDSAGYVAVERVVGTLHWREGTFVLHHLALMDRGKGDLRIAVVPDSGTGELVGIRGSVAVTPGEGAHSYVFDYTLDEA